MSSRKGKGKTTGEGRKSILRVYLGEKENKKNGLSFRLRREHTTGGRGRVLPNTGERKGLLTQGVCTPRINIGQEGDSLGRNQSKPYILELLNRGGQKENNAGGPEQAECSAPGADPQTSKSRPLGKREKKRQILTD